MKSSFTDNLHILEQKLLKKSQIQYWKRKSKTFLTK